MKMDRIVQDTLHQVEEVTKAKGLHDEYVFLNNAYSSQNPIRRYGMNEFRKMKRISREVDPGQMFQRQVPGGFKLNEVQHRKRG